MRSPELREAAFDAVLQSPVPAPSAVPQGAMPFSTQLHHKIFSHRVSVVSQPSPSSLSTGARHTERSLVLAERVAKVELRFKFVIHISTLCHKKTQDHSGNA